MNEMLKELAEDLRREIEQATRSNDIEGLRRAAKGVVKQIVRRRKKNKISGRRRVEMEQEYFNLMLRAVEEERAGS